MGSGFRTPRHMPRAGFLAAIPGMRRSSAEVLTHPVDLRLSSPR